MEKQIFDLFTAVLKKELVPAMGCTEPIAIAYCAAKATEVLGQLPERMEVICSGNVIKNVKGVTVPNSGGLKGISVAAVLGAVGGQADKELEVISQVQPEQIKKTVELLSDPQYCKCLLQENVDNLYIKINVYAKDNQATVEIQGKHTNITLIEKNKEILLQKDYDQNEGAEEFDLSAMSVKSILEYADQVDLNDVKEVLQRQIDYNSAIAKEGLTNDWGVRAGKVLMQCHGDYPSVCSLSKAAAAAGSDARMSGCALPVVINSGSGNQGITLTLPIVEYAKTHNISEELKLRGLLVANLVAIHQKRFIGDLSAYCGAVCAATGAISGIAYMDKADYDVIAGTITNCICTVGGMVCDGAKPSCATKISTAIDSAFQAYEIRKKGGVFAEGEGLTKNDVEATIRSIGRVAKEGLKQTDIEILEIMLED